MAGKKIKLTASTNYKLRELGACIKRAIGALQYCILRLCLINLIIKKFLSELSEIFDKYKNEF